jgi:nucleoside-diphosphate-sugar epimerase
VTSTLRYGSQHRTTLSHSECLTIGQLCTSVTHIFHLAWRLDFNLKLTSFEMNIQGTRHLLDLALAARGRVRFIFTSSVSVASSWPLVKGPYPEEPVNDAGTVADASGYGQSKFVAEQVRTLPFFRFMSSS